MNLPELPKKYKRIEAKIDGLVIDWFYNNYPRSVLIEAKIKGNKMLPHQKLAQDEVNKNKKFKYKFPDQGLRLPADGIVLKDAEAWCVTCDGMNCTGVSEDKKIEFKISKKK